MSPAFNINHCSFRCLSVGKIKSGAVCLFHKNELSNDVAGFDPVTLESLFPLAHLIMMHSQPSTLALSTLTLSASHYSFDLLLPMQTFGVTAIIVCKNYNTASCVLKNHFLSLLPSYANISSCRLRSTDL